MHVDHHNSKIGDWVETALETNKGEIKVRGFITAFISKYDGVIKFQAVSPAEFKGKNFKREYEEVYKCNEELSTDEIKEAIDLSLDLKDKDLFHHYAAML